MIKVSSAVRIYETNGDEATDSDKHLHVESHWNRTEMVILSIDNLRITVSAKDLEAAIANAKNSARF